MDFALSEQQRMLTDSVAGYLTANCPLELIRQTAESGETHNPALAQGLAELGVSGLVIPEDFGGVGLGYLEAALVAECIGSVVAPVTYLATSVLAPSALLSAGSDEQQQAWLPRIAAGEVSIGVAVSEHSGRRDSDGVTASNGQLAGSAMFAFDAIGADAYLVADNAGALYLVEASATDVVHLHTIDRTRGFARLNFEGTPAEVLPGSVDTKEVLQNIIDIGRLLLAAETLGACQKMLDDSVAYAKERKQFNRVIGSFQAVKHMCAEMAAELEPCRAMVWYAAHSRAAAPDEARMMACHAKAHLAEVGKFVARTATEVHGGMGMTDLLGLHYWFKRIGMNRQLLGTPERVREDAALAQGW